MALTKAQGKFSQAIDDGADAVAITIDSSEQVGIGTASPNTYADRVRQLVVGGSSHAGITVFGGTSSSRASLQFTTVDDTGINHGLIDYYNDSDRMAFLTGGSERMRIDSDGLKFGTDTAAANALDDYEEGTWTPTSSSNISAIANVSGNYTKIGNVVHVSFYADITPTSSSTQIRVGGLPYAVADKISGTSFEGTGVVFEDSSLYFFAAFGGSSDLWIEYDRPMQGSSTTTNRSYRGSVTYYAA